MPTGGLPSSSPIQQYLDLARQLQAAQDAFKASPA
jgi:hypothetical protein